MKKLTINQLKNIEKWSYRLIFVFAGLVFLSITIPKNAYPRIHLGPITSLQSLITWIFVSLQIISGIISIYALIKASLLERAIKKESR